MDNDMLDGSIPRQRSLVVAAVLVALVGWVSSCTTESDVLTTSSTGHGCYPSEVSDPVSRAMEIRRGDLAVPSYPSVRIGEDVDWGMHPHDASWSFTLHSMTYVYVLREAYIATEDDGHLRRAEALLRDWGNDNIPIGASQWAWNEHTTALRAQVMTCLYPLLDSPMWLEELLVVHRDALADPARYAGPWNHGFDQNLALLAIGCTVDDQAAADVAVQRVRDAVPTMVDEQGASNEQAVGYHHYVWTLLSRFAAELAACDRRELQILDRRHEIPQFLAHATRPDGNWETIGDTHLQRAQRIVGTPLEYAASQGEVGAPPRDPVRVFDRGWVFGRTGWGSERQFDEETFYSLRFGEGRQVHGHRDHTSVTWFARGRELLTEAGFGGYGNEDFREFERSERAHNQIVVDGMGRYRWEAPTRLTSSEQHAWADVYDLFGTPYVGVDRRRTVLFGFDPLFVLVRDNVVTSAGRDVAIDQLWHLPVGFGVETEEDRVVASDGELSVHFVPLGDHDAFEVVEGARDPLQGWRALQRGDRVPAPVVASTLTAQSAQVLTLIAVGDVVDVHFDGEVLRIMVDGYERAVRVAARGAQEAPLQPVG